jgi:hypothetical protein
MGVGIAIGRGSMGGPSSVADPDRTLHRVLLEEEFQLLEFSLTAAYLNRPLTDHRDAGAIVATILKAPKPLNNQRDAVLRSDIADDSTHV